MVTVKGHEIKATPVKSAFNRKALQFNNNIITLLKRIGVDDRDIDIPFENMAIKKAKASVTWYVSDHRMYFSHNLQNRFVDNLYVVFKVIEIETNQILSEKKTLDEFIKTFREDSDIENKRKDARKYLDLDPEENDLDIINKKYKTMARKLHPDMSTGDTEKFKQLNNAHKTLKRELS